MKPYRIKVTQQGPHGLWLWDVSPEGRYTAAGHGLEHSRRKALSRAKRAARRHARGGGSTLNHRPTTMTYVVPRHSWGVVIARGLGVVVGLALLFAWGVWP